MSEMNNEREFFTLVDEESGNEIEFEKIGEAELNGKVYFALIPSDGATSEDGFCEYVVLRLEEENGEATLVTVDDDDEFDNVADVFDDMFSEEIDYDGK